MYVEKLELRNVRSYENASISFSKGINLIIGANNSGKSTILKCLTHLQHGLPAFDKEDVRKTCSFGKIHFQFTDIKKDDKLLFRTKEDKKEFEIGTSQSIVAAAWNPGEKKGNDFFLIDNLTTELVLSETDIEARNKKMPSDSPVMSEFVKFPSMEDENNFIYPFLSKRKAIHNSGQGGRQTAFNITEGLQNLPSRIQNLANGTHPFNNEYRKYSKDILGFEVGKVPHSQSNEDRLGIFVKQGEMIYLESMGEGVANILGLMSILLTADNKLFLIEEIENDIHPEALKKLLQLIIEKASSNQFIISTHSNIVLKYLASLDSTKIFYADWQIKKIGNGSKINLPTSTIAPVENTPVERWRILEKLGFDLFDFDLFKSYVIFEESSAEQIVRDFLIPQFFPGLQFSLRTVAASGAADLTARFSDFYRLFVFIHTAPLYEHKAWVIADGDDEGLTSIKKLKGKFKSWPQEHFMNFSKNNFEEFYPEPFNKSFLEIKKNKNPSERKEQKEKLTRSIIDWIKKDPATAKAAFKESAKEVIDFLSKINKALS